MPASTMVPVPARGRRFTAERRVRLGDVDPGGRLRLDALARYLQDVSSDDTLDAQLADQLAWVVRRTVVEVARPASFGEGLTLTTFCGGIGRRWAERRVSLVGTRGAAIQAASLWVHLDPGTGRPRALPPEFLELFGEAASGRTVGARLVHRGPPADGLRRRWPLRRTDLDLLGHVNNAAYWEVVEEELAGRPGSGGPLRAELEFRTPVEPDGQPEAVVADGDGGLALWLVEGTIVHASAVVVPLPPVQSAATT